MTDGIWVEVVVLLRPWAFYFNIYLAALGLSCGMWDLVTWLGMEPGAFLPWEHWVFTIGPLGKSPDPDLEQLLAFSEPQVVAPQLLSHVWFFVTPWATAHQASITNSQSLLKLMSVESVIPSNHLIPCRPLADIYPKKIKILICKDTCECMLSHFSCVHLFATPWTVAHQGPLFMGFSRQEY